MPPSPHSPRPLSHVLRALIEVGFIIFLFYSNLLMGEFSRTNGHGNFSIAILAATIAYLVFEHLRKKL